MLAAHQRTRESFGPERLQKHLDQRGVQPGVHRIKRLRKKLGLRCRQKRRFEGDDQIDARPACGTKPAESGFHRNRAKSGLVWRYHVYRKRRGLAVPCRPERSVQRRAGRLRHERAHDEPSGDAGVVPRGCIAAPGGRLNPLASTRSDRPYEHRGRKLHIVPVRGRSDRIDKESGYLAHFSRPQPVLSRENLNV